MRKLIAILTIFLSLNLYSQHLSFKGIPMDGNAYAFASKLKSQGFYTHPLASEFEGSILLKGTFAGMKNCSVAILYTPKTKVVAKVSVISDHYYSWDQIKRQYNIILQALSKKYRKLDDSCLFLSPYEEGDGYEFLALKTEKAFCKAFMGSEAGSIVISIEASQMDKGDIIISYEDSQNFALYQSERENAIINDL